MRTKYIDKRGWRRIKQSSYSEKIITHKETQCLIGLLSIHRVTEPLTVKILEHDICVVNSGFRWLTIMPEDTKYSITVMYDQHWQALQYYIDINYRHVLERGRARRKDLYLDVLVLPNGAHELVDKEDLKEALSKGKVTRAQHDCAFQTADEVIEMIKTDFHKFTAFCEMCRTQMI